MYQGEQTVHSKHRYYPLCWAVFRDVEGDKDVMSTVIAHYIGLFSLTEPKGSGKPRQVIAHYIGLFSRGEFDHHQKDNECYCPLYRAVFLFRVPEDTPEDVIVIAHYIGLFSEESLATFEAEIVEVIAHYIGLFSDFYEGKPQLVCSYCPLYRAVFLERGRK